MEKKKTGKRGKKTLRIQGGACGFRQAGPESLTKMPLE